MEKDPKIPDNYHTVMPYLILENAAGFIVFSQKVFDAKETHKAMRAENIIQHAEIMIGDSTIMFADSTEQYAPQTANLFVYVDDADKRFQKALAAGGKVVMPLADQPYGRSGGVLDPFGNVWWITAVK
jgi:PhnB protein